MIGCLRTRVRKQPIIALYFESELILKFYNLEAWLLFSNYVFAVKWLSVFSNLLVTLVGLAIVIVAFPGHTH